MASVKEKCQKEDDGYQSVLEGELEHPSEPITAPPSILCDLFQGKEECLAADEKAHSQGYKPHGENTQNSVPPLLPLRVRRYHRQCDCNCGPRRWVGAKALQGKKRARQGKQCGLDEVSISQC